MLKLKGKALDMKEGGVKETERSCLRLDTVSSTKVVKPYTVPLFVCYFSHC